MKNFLNKKENFFIYPHSVGHIIKYNEKLFNCPLIVEVFTIDDHWCNHMTIHLCSFPIASSQYGKHLPFSFVKTASNFYLKCS